MNSERVQQRDIAEENVIISLPNHVRPSSKLSKALQDIIRTKNQEAINPNYSQRKGSMVKQSHIPIRKLNRPSCCSICDGETQISHQTFIADCEHKHMFCESCLNLYAIYVIEQGGKVRCPSSGCSSELQTNRVFFKSLPAAIQTKYRRILRSNAAINPMLRLCPLDFQGILRLNQKSLRCDACQADFCPHCLLSTHDGDCDPFEQKLFQQVLRYRQCPRCHNITDKSQGSNHMVCRCKHQFCYVCKANWHKDHRGDHDEKGNAISSCAIELDIISNNIQNDPEPQQQKEPQCCSRKPDCFFFATLLPRFILFIIAVCLLVPLFALLIVAAIFVAIFTGKRKYHSDTPDQIEQRRKANSYLEDMCLRYFGLYKILAIKLLSP